MEKVIVCVSKTPKGYCAGIAILPGWVMAVTGSFSDFKRELAESIQVFITWAKKDGDPYPAVFDREYEFEYLYDIESLMCFYEGIITKAALSRLTGINQKQLGRYANGQSKPREAQVRKIRNALYALGEELLAISV